MNLGSQLEQYAKIVLAVVAIGAVLQTAVIAFGGDIPPWASERDFRDLRGRVEGFETERDGNRCADARRRLNNARQRFQARPMDTFEEENISTILMEMRRITGCVSPRIERDDEW